MKKTTTVFAVESSEGLKHFRTSEAAQIWASEHTNIDGYDYPVVDGKMQRIARLVPCRVQARVAASSIASKMVFVG